MPNKSKGIIFKVDFDNTYDDVNWDFLDKSRGKRALVLNGVLNFELYNSYVLHPC